MSCQGTQAARLHILTFSQTPAAPPCVGGFCCACPACDMERGQIVARGPKKVRQPWEGNRRAA
jgi:hypothetical protein